MGKGKGEDGRPQPSGHSKPSILPRGDAFLPFSVLPFITTWYSVGSGRRWIQQQEDASDALYSTRVLGEVGIHLLWLRGYLRQITISVGLDRHSAKVKYELLQAAKRLTDFIQSCIALILFQDRAEWPARFPLDAGLSYTESRGVSHRR